MTMSSSDYKLREQHEDHITLLLSAIINQSATQLIVRGIPLTAKEQSILNVMNYHDLTRGLWVGTATFITLWGMFQYRRLRTMSRLGLFDDLLPSPQLLRAARESSLLVQKSAQPTKKDPQWTTKSPPTATTVARSTMNQNSVVQTAEAGTGGAAGESTARQSPWKTAQAEVQLMLSGITSVIVGWTAARLHTNYDNYYSNVSTIPLQPGKSYLSHFMCPRLIELEKEHLANKVEWQNPETSELESMVRLVYNCQKRMEYLNSLDARQKTTTTTTTHETTASPEKSADPLPVIVESVPESGLPLPYLTPDED